MPTVTIIYRPDGLVLSDFEIRNLLEDYSYAEWIGAGNGPIVVSTENYIRLVLYYVAKGWLPWKEVQFIVDEVSYGVNRYGQFITSYPPNSINLGYEISKLILQLANNQE